MPRFEFGEDEERAWVPFVMGTLHLLALLDAELKAAYNISHLDYGILILLSQMPERTQRMSVFATTFGVDPGTITYRARRMEARGLVERHASLTDGRGVCLQLTEAGLALLRKAHQVHVAGAKRHFLDHLDPTQLHALATIFGHLRAVQAHPDEGHHLSPSPPMPDSPRH